MSKIIKWFKDGNDCSKCPFGWETCTSTEHGTEYDGGCYIKGYSWDDSRCYIIPPFRWVIGKIRKKNADYYFIHEYDDIGEWVKKEEEKEDKFKKSIDNFLDSYYLCTKSDDGTFQECDKQMIILSDTWRIRSEYDNYAHPFIHRSLKQKWAELITETYSQLINKFKPYFCK